MFVRAQVLYEGKPVGTPDAGQFWRVADRHDVRVLYTAPTAMRAVKKEDPEGKFIDQSGLLAPTSKFRALFLAGERSDPDTVRWATAKLNGRPVVDNYWQTETGKNSGASVVAAVSLDFVGTVLILYFVCITGCFGLFLTARVVRVLFLQAGQ